MFIDILDNVMKFRVFEKHHSWTNKSLSIENIKRTFNQKSIFK